jgi:hypothetical protein
MIVFLDQYWLIIVQRSHTLSSSGEFGISPEADTHPHNLQHGDPNFFFMPPSPLIDTRSFGVLGFRKRGHLSQFY